MRAKVSRKSPMVTRMVPTGSRARAASLRDSRTEAAATAKPTAAMGMFTKNTADHPESAMSTPPPMGPARKPSPATLAQMPMAVVRRSGG
jgi:hypothetical protein